MRRVGSISSLALRNPLSKRNFSITSKCPVTGTFTDTDAISPVVKGDCSRPYSEIPGPLIYPLLGSILDFKKQGGTMLLATSEYYKKYGMIVKHNITRDEVIIADPREYVKGKLS